MASDELAPPAAARRESAIRSLIWVDGALRPATAAAVRGDDSAYAEGRGCYSSVRIRAGAPRFAERHVERLARDARALGLPPPDRAVLHRALHELARAAFADGDGIVRLSLSRDGAGGLHAIGVPRGLGEDPRTWRAVTAPLAHPGPLDCGGAKLTNRLALALALDAARAAGADEALLFDARGHLVEGARTNIVAIAGDGTLCTPPAERGAVAGVALEIACERLPGLRRRDLSRRALLAARGVAAINSVRGARALVALDGERLGGEGETLARRLAAALDDE